MPKVTTHNGDTVVAATTSPKVAIKYNMLRQIQNTISKVLDLRKGLVLLGLVSILVSGFVIGGEVSSLKVIAATNWIRIQTLTGNSDGGDPGGTLFNGEVDPTNYQSIICSIQKNGNNPKFVSAFGANEKIYCLTKIDDNNATLFGDCTVNQNNANVSASCPKNLGTQKLLVIDDSALNNNAAFNSITQLKTLEAGGKTEQQSNVLDYKNVKDIVVCYDSPQPANFNDCKVKKTVNVKCADAVSGVEICIDTSQKIYACAFQAGKGCKLTTLTADKVTTAADLNKPEIQAVTGITDTIKPEAPIEKKDNSFLGGLFTLIYKIVAAIIMALLFLVRYLQMTVLLLFISVMTVLLNLSPNTGFLTTLAVPLWSIFAQIASLGAVGILIFLGSATMIGIEGFEYDKTIAKGAKVAIYVFVSNFTYFGLAFAISLLDGFTKLIVFVFGGGSVFKLFEALIASVSSISRISAKGQTGNSLIPDFTGGFAAVGEIFGKNDAGGVTTTLVSEIIVVIGLGLIIWVFGRIFFMLLTRVAILLLLLITSPIWVLGILVKDSLPSELQGQVTKAVSLVSGTVLFNFAFITTLVLVTIITQKINGGISEFQKTIVANFEPATNTGLAFIDGVSANAQATSGVLSNDAFLGFGAGGFGDTISVCAVLGINLAIIYFAFDAIANLIDTNIQAVGKAVGGAVSKNLQNFRKADSFGQGLAMMGQDALKYGTLATTGGNGLISDAAGAGLKGVSMTERGLRTTGRGILDGTLEKGIRRRTYGVANGLNIGKDGWNIKDVAKNTWNIKGNIGKNLNNTIRGTQASEKAERLEKENNKEIEEITKLGNDKSQTDDRLENALNDVENNDITNQADKDTFKDLRNQRAIGKKSLDEAKEAIDKNVQLVKDQLAAKGKDLTDNRNWDQEDRDLVDNISDKNIELSSLVSDLTAKNTQTMAEIFRFSGNSKGSSILNLDKRSDMLKDAVVSRTKTLRPKQEEVRLARREEGHERLEILKQKGKNLKDKADYNKGGFTGTINNLELISKGLDAAASKNNKAQIEEVNSLLSDLVSSGTLDQEQANQVKAQLTKDKEFGSKDLGKSLEEILKKLDKD